MSDFDVQLVRLDGGGRRTLTHGPQWDIDAQWSPDGLLLAFQRMPPGAVWQKAWTWTIRPDGRGLRRLTRGGGARWSPDGTRLAVHRPTATSEADLFVVDRTGRHARLLLASPEIDQPADWSPDGRLVLFTRYTEDGGTEVRLVGADGRGERKVATGTAGSFSPDGHWLVYTDARTGRLAVVRPDGSGRRVLARLVGLDPHWG
jgi:TolB protein